LSPDGYCKPFNTGTDGFSRSETVGAIYLQKKKHSKRIYATCSYVKTNSDGYKEEGITYPSTLMQSTLLKEFYNECGIPTSCLDYIEAHGTGTKVGDIQEVNAIDNIFCKNRETPLMIGSVKSNLGHAEPASGFTQIAKVKQVDFAFIYYFYLTLLLLLFHGFHKQKKNYFTLNLLDKLFYSTRVRRFIKRLRENLSLNQETR